MTNFAQHSGHPPTGSAARPTLVRVWYHSIDDGSSRATLVSKWISIPHAHDDALDTGAFHLCSIELGTQRETSASAEFEDPGPVFSPFVFVTRA